MTKELLDVKKVFWASGTCSCTFFYLLNREFDQSKEQEEKASHPLAGGIIKRGHQCGMLWGATLAIGAESYRRKSDIGQAVALAMKVSKRLVRSFSDLNHTVNCREITQSNFMNVFSMTKYLLFKARSCFIMAEKWAPDAINSAVEGLTVDQSSLPQTAMSCTSEMAMKMGASSEEIVTVSGLAGGIGLSGNGCGALAAAIWLHTLKWYKETGKSSYFNPKAQEILKNFEILTNGKLTCQSICQKRFATIDEHTEFVKNGGCNNIIEMLAKQ